MYTEEELELNGVRKTKRKICYIGTYKKFPQFIKEVQEIAENWGVSLDVIELQITSEHDMEDLYVTTEYFPKTKEEIEQDLQIAKENRKKNDEWDRQQFERLKAKFGDK